MPRRTLARRFGARWALAALLGAGCDGEATDPVADVGGADSADSADSADGASAEAAWKVITFNTGTSEGMGHDEPPDDGYDGAMAARSDLYYGDGLAWLPAVAAASKFLQAEQPDIVGFQEIFDATACADLPAAATPGFYCETWTPGTPTVAAHILGAGYQLACHPGKSDKCLGVRQGFATLRGCQGGDCAGAGVGKEVPGCGKGARVARFTLDLKAGGALTVIHVHGSSGFGPSDQACRVGQFEAALGALLAEAEEPTAPRLVLGDFNTDPGRFATIDPSAKRLLELADAAGLSFITAVGKDVPPTYGGIVNIDHVLADRHVGSCWHAGAAGKPKVLDAIYFDHLPAVCALEPATESP